MDEEMKKIAIRMLRNLAREIEGGEVLIESLAKNRGFATSEDPLRDGHVLFFPDGTYSLSMTVRKKQKGRP